MEKTINRREQRLATIERREHRGRVNREPHEPRETISARQRAEVGAVRRPCLVKAGRGGKRWSGRWAISTLSGQKAGKWCSFSHLETAFSHLFPPFSTQVVDFPHICTVRLFWGSPEMLATDETQTKSEPKAEMRGEGSGRKTQVAS